MLSEDGKYFPAHFVFAQGCMGDAEAERFDFEHYEANVAVGMVLVRSAIEFGKEVDVGLQDSNSVDVKHW